METVIRFAKGGVSGLVSGALLQPLQVIKTSMQVKPIEAQTYLNKQVDPKQKKLNLTFKEATELIYRKEGANGFLRGLWPSMIKNTLNSGSYFSILFYSENSLRQVGFKNEQQIQFASSAFARTIQSVVSNPLVVIKTRFEVVGFTEYSGIIDASKQIVRKEGYRGFFTGLGISLIRDVPFSGIFYPVYHSFRTFYSILLIGHKVSDNKQVNLALVTSLASWSANIVSCVLTHPLDLIRTRVYFQFYNKEESEQYKGLIDAIKKIYQNDGFKGYFRGLMPRIVRKGFATIIAWVAYEYLINKEDAFISS